MAGFRAEALPVSAMTPAEQKTLVTELLFRSPKAAFEFVSENHRYLEPTEVNEGHKRLRANHYDRLLPAPVAPQHQPEDGIFQRGAIADLSRLRRIKSALTW